MTDLETRLGDALRQHADGMGAVHGLAAVARERAGRRRRARRASIVVAAVVLIGAPAAVVHGMDHDAAPAPAPASDRTTVEDDGLRWESWHGVSLQVPEDWGYGAVGACGNPSRPPVVERPGLALDAVGCEQSRQAYGVAFAPTRPLEGPPGAFRASRVVDGVEVQVVAPDEAVGTQVLDSVIAFGSSDPNGCPPRVGDDIAMSYDGHMTVCRYDASGLLEESELLDEEQTTEARAALDSTRQGELDCQPAVSPQQTVKMYDFEHDNVIALDGACTMVGGWPDGIADADVLYWALSPGFTGDVTGLRVPPQLRSE